MARGYNEARESLLRLVPAGSRVYALFRSRADYLKVVDFYVVAGGEIVWISGYVATLMNLKLQDDDRGLRLHGGGTDLGHDTVVGLAQALYGDALALKYDTL